MNEEQWENAFAENEDRSLGLERGMFFVSDVVELEGRNSWTIGTSKQYTPTSDQMPAVYQEETMAGIRANMEVSSVVAIECKKPKKRRRHQNGITSLYDALWTTGSPTKYTLSDLRGVTMLETTAWQQLDNLEAEDSDLSDAWTLLCRGDVRTSVNHILLQFVYDIFHACPNNRKHGAYVNLSEEELDNIRVEYLQDNILPFISTHLIHPSITKWAKVLQFLFPDKGYLPVKNAKIYRRCLYYHAWTGLMNRLTSTDAALVATAMRRVVSRTMDWLPDATASSLWSATSVAERNWVTLPYGWEDGAPRIVVNPKKYRANMIVWWELRAEDTRPDNEESEVDDMDSDSDYEDDDSSTGSSSAWM